MANIDDLKKLHPAERIKRLKELEEERKKEIEEANKLLKQTEGEIEDEHNKKMQVPIDEIKQETMEGLGGDAKLIFATKRFSQMSPVQAKEKKEKAEETEELSLEEQVAASKPGMPAGRHDEYFLHMSRQPIDELNQRLQNVYETVKEKGYVNQDEMKNIYEIQQAMYRKEEATEAGQYNPGESVADKLDTAKQMIKKLIANYDNSNDYQP